MWWLLPTLAFADPYYESMLPPVYYRGGPADMRFIVAADLDERGLAVWREGGDAPVKVMGPKVSDQLVAAVFVALRVGRPGMELDAILGVGQPSLRPITVRWEDDRLVVLEGESLHTLLLPGPSPEELLARFRIGGLQADWGRWWDRHGTGLLAAALAALSPHELDRMAEVTFRRRVDGGPAPSMPGQVIAATYDEVGGIGVIDLFDAAFQPDPQFVGEPSHPMPTSYLLLLHEMGHALSRWSLRSSVEASAGLIERRQALGVALGGLLAERQSAEGARVEELDAEIAALRADDRALEENIARIARAGLLGSGAPARALSAAMGSRPSPTAYGRTSTEESFAECFALYHADRAALERTAPEAVAFFDAQGHIVALDEAWAEVEAILAEVSPPPPPTATP